MNDPEDTDFAIGNKTIDVLILTTAHDAEDGRLVRHQNSFGRAGLSAEIVSLQFNS